MKPVAQAEFLHALCRVWTRSVTASSADGLMFRRAKKVRCWVPSAMVHCLNGGHYLDGGKVQFNSDAWNAYVAMGLVDDE